MNEEMLNVIPVSSRAKTKKSEIIEERTALGYAPTGPSRATTLSIKALGKETEERLGSIGKTIAATQKELEQNHVCLGTSASPQNHPDRYASYVLNTLVGGSMSSRLFQRSRFAS
jgi:hypothetical protein